MTNVINSILTEMKMALSRGTVDMTQVRRWKIGLEAHKAAPVTEEMVERALLALSGHCIDCRPHWAENRRDRELIRDALTEALTAPTPPATAGEE